MKLIAGLTPDKQIAKKYLRLFKNQNLLLRLTNEANSVYVQSVAARPLQQILNRHVTLTKKAPETLWMLVYGEKEILNKKVKKAYQVCSC